MKKGFVYQFFGSPSSQDYDVMVFVDQKPESISEGHEFCKDCNDIISIMFPDKPINCNLAMVENGRIWWVFKGTENEVNNSLFHTYNYHPQLFDNQIISPVERTREDLEIKLNRLVRNLISYFSRGPLRKEIKEALRGNLYQRCAVLEMIDFMNMTSFPQKGKIEDVYKTIAFQYGQFFSLVDGKEPLSYTKEDLSSSYPQLKSFLFRKPGDLSVLEDFRKRTLEFVIENEISIITESEPI